MQNKFIKPEVISLKNSRVYTEKWLQKQIEDDPSLIGLGDLEFRNTEKILIGGGRLDTILYDPEDLKRYEVEIQLGKTDETHIIRTIEYWDIEKKRNPQYEHCAVIIAEDITSRFLNVISLFNGFIPIIAIQVKALQFGDNISLFFTKVLDETKFELLEEDTITETVNRQYWEEKANKNMLKLVDEIIDHLDVVREEYNLKYNKHYIGLEKNGSANNFVNFKPRKNSVIIHIKLDKLEEYDDLIEQYDIEEMSYEKRFKQYRFKINKKDISTNIALIKQLVNAAKENYRN
jgi:predicted DNA binding CopG/RHH family protein